MSDSPDRLINQRYAVVRLLGEGGMGSVYLVRDTYQGGRPIALKILRSEGLDSESIERFKSEFRSMARLRHPNLAEVYDFGTVQGDGRYFLTMEYVKGEDLGRQSRSDLVERFDSLALQCLRALDYIHSRGLLHNDVKPHNIMIQPPFQVRLLDLGLAQGQAEAARPGVSGTLHYIAPERFGDQKADARSDLYSLGVVLYEVLTGSLPYQGADAGQVIGAILRGDARSPRALNPAVTERIERFTLALMGRTPGSRPADAAAALDLLNSGRVEPLRIDTPETYASFVTSGRFIGRDQDLDKLTNLATEHVGTADGDEALPRLILLSGPSGIGKSRLLREMKHRLQLAGIRNFTGRCYQDGGVPFHPFVEVLRQLPRPPEMPDELGSVVNQLVPPEATGEPSPSGGSEPAERIGKREFIRAVGDSLAHLAQGARGVVFLEDLHWSDAPGVDLLEHLVLRPGRGPWLYIGSLRDEEGRSAPIAALLKRLSTSTRCLRITLAPLNADQVTELLASMVPFGERPEGLARILAERTEGNPLYLEEIMKVLAEEGTLRRHDGSWVAESRTLEAIRLPPSLASAVAQRISALPANDRHVAEVLAVFNRPVDV
ncbi:MAG TPA: protein kinase, partial [Candidatus Polarisedimenticolia bacterium]|nr:protein kinase [Candidatus Polarisedimenticolia bacterium]